VISDDHLDAFFSASLGRASNDSENKLREYFVCAVLNRRSEGRSAMRDGIRRNNDFDKLTKALDDAVRDIDSLQPELRSWALENVEGRGGRGHNYDFVFTFSQGPERKEVKVELKKGRSIYDQPQFLQAYVNSQGILVPEAINYAEYFFDNYFHELRRISGCSSVEKTHYLRGVYGTSYNEIPFRELKTFVSEASSREKLLDLQHRSIDTYLARLVNDKTQIDFANLQKRLFEQLDKVFLSWNPAVFEFSWERFSERSLKLTGEVKGKAGRDDRLNTVVLPTSTGQEIHMLLRWKNNPCVKGPAWQIKLTPN
jgi:hypothetical protein